jgi:hypothetical protein
MAKYRHVRATFREASSAYANTFDRQAWSRACSAFVIAPLDTECGSLSH